MLAAFVHLHLHYIYICPYTFYPFTFAFTFTMSIYICPLPGMAAYSLAAADTSRKTKLFLLGKSATKKKKKMWNNLLLQWKFLTSTYIFFFSSFSSFVRESGGEWWFDYIEKFSLFSFMPLLSENVGNITFNIVKIMCDWNKSTVQHAPSLSYKL